MRPRPPRHPSGPRALRSPDMPEPAPSPWERLKGIVTWPHRRLQRWMDERDGPELAMEVVRLVEVGDFDSAVWLEREHLNPIQRRLGMTPTDYAARERRKKESNQ